jgi:TolA-binding protein
MRVRTNLAAALSVLLGACAGTQTLKHLENTTYVFAPDKNIPDAPDKVTSAYVEYLKLAPQERQRPEAMHRLGDLEMRTAEERLAGESGAKAGENYRNAITAYQDLLKTYPNYVGTDQVLYQLARAQEQAGDIDATLQTLDRLVRQFPASPYRDETQFRRGELSFARHDYFAAEQAYGAVLGSDRPTPFRERARYMLGWTRFKQARMEDALNAFFDVLDAALADRRDDGPLEQVNGLTRADRELIADALRVTSLCFENLQGAASIPPYFQATPKRQSYEFRVYQQLAELYVQQDRVKDAGETLITFVRTNPMHALAPQLQARAIEIYQQAGFIDLALQAKKDYVAHYGVETTFRQANPSGWERAQAVLKSSLADLARHYHAAAQKGHKADDYREAARWYREYLASFPDDPQAARTNFMLAESLFEGGQYAEAAGEYERSAYRYAQHDKGADAGYSALLAYAEQEKHAQPTDVEALRRTAVDSGLRFARAYGSDPRAGPVLADAAEKLYGRMRNPEAAAAVARQLLALVPAAAVAQQRAAWTLIAHAAFDGAAFSRAEAAYNEALALTPKNDPERGALTERLAASIYKQGEQARSEARLREAAAHFARVGAAAPTSSVRATAQYDAAAALIGLKDWPAATSTLEDFRRRFPDHALQGEATAKLAVSYLELGQGALAAAEFERVAASARDPSVARDALWQAAELYQKAGRSELAGKAYARYVARYPEPLEAAE